MRHRFALPSRVEPTFAPRQEKSLTMIKDIIVHLDGSADDAVRLAHAERIAAIFGAHIRGLYANILPEITLAMAEYAAVTPVIAASQDEARANGDQIERTLRRRFETIAAPAELRRFDLFADGLWRTVASQARTADLMVTMKPYRADAPDCWPQVIEAALFASGRGVYVVPDEAIPVAQGTVEHMTKTVLVAWNDTREAARALSEAMPFLEKAQDVVVAIVDRDGPAEARNAEPGADIARHLDRHGVKVELRHVANWDNTADALLNEIRRLDVGLVVLGAYGHSRFREWITGGVTRRFLTDCPSPMLMAH